MVPGTVQPTNFRQRCDAIASRGFVSITFDWLIVVLSFTRAGGGDNLLLFLMLLLLRRDAFVVHVIVVVLIVFVGVVRSCFC